MVKVLRGKSNACGSVHTAAAQDGKPGVAHMVVVRVGVYR